jgi:DNA invertase Pin-like site-specific DNA recombinase
LIENQLWLTETATGQLVFHIFGALAEFKRNLIKERTMAGLSAARARGRKGGRPKLKTQDSKVATANNTCAKIGQLARASVGS